jgi:hypothetical protein
MMVENKRTCATTVFDGQRLSLKDDKPPVAAPAPKPAPRKRSSARQPAAAEVPAKKPEGSTLSSIFGRFGQ